MDFEEATKKVLETDDLYQFSEYTHDKNAYTQGLEFYKNQLYESTGLNGKSSLRKVNFFLLLEKIMMNK